MHAVKCGCVIAHHMMVKPCKMPGDTREKHGLNVVCMKGELLLHISTWRSLVMSPCRAPAELASLESKLCMQSSVILLHISR